MTELLLFLGAGLIGGVVNAMAGGAKLFVFPLLLASGLPPIVANATGTAGVWPAQLPAALVYRKELLAHWRRLLLRLLPAVAGACVGAFALIHSSDAAFLSVVPILLAISVTAIVLGPRAATLARSWMPGSQLKVISIALLFGCGLYGGYFGAGVGFMLLAVLSLADGGGYRQANAQKNAIAFLMNSIAIVPLGLSGLIDWFAAATVVVGCLCGGYVGGRLTRSLPEGPTRIAVALLGILLTVAFLVHRSANNNSMSGEYAFTF
ncbi:MAG: sulfite exporter TauE/SafE family protein [Pseudomonadota bacterium]